MEANFWHQIWEDKKIGFHEAQVNPLVVDHFKALDLSSGARIFLPLCGKTLDIKWLLDQGYQVVGAELSELAVRELFDSLSLEPEVYSRGKLTLYKGANIDIFVGDLFDVTAELLESVDAVYDRAALIALPNSMREQYSQHLLTITHGAKQLLICLEYDQELMNGPPFSITEREVFEYYSKSHSITRLESRSITGGFKGEIPATDTVWLLT